MDIFPVSWCETNGYPLQHPCKPRGQCYSTNAPFQRTSKCCVHINWCLYLKWLDKILKFMFNYSGETEKGCSCSARETVSKTQKCWNWVQVVLIMEKHSFISFITAGYHLKTPHLILPNNWLTAVRLRLVRARYTSEHLHTCMVFLVRCLQS